MTNIAELRGLEVLDSRGRPTVKVTCRLSDGASGAASVPSGASSGAAEAHELRDGDTHRYGGLGCLRAVSHVNREIAGALTASRFDSQAELDRTLCELDGTPNKSRLGANAILAVSLAFARACACSEDVPLYRYFSGLVGRPALRVPRPTINLFSGGLHAGGQVAIQDVLVVPARASTIRENLADTYAVFQAAAALSSERYEYRLLRADEGGLAPPFGRTEEMLAMAVDAIEGAGLRPGEDVFLAVDVASSHFYEFDGYRLDGRLISGEEMIETIQAWVDRYPIVSVEDGLAEEDWTHWPALLDRLRGRARVVGDDLLCTHPARIEKAIQTASADTLLLKVNQIGTLSEAAEACLKARAAGWQVTVSARSGETEDHWLADLAVGWAGNQIKVGSITQSERLAKYNRLLEIEASEELAMEPWPKSG